MLMNADMEQPQMSSSRNKIKINEEWKLSLSTNSVCLSLSLLEMFVSASLIVLGPGARKCKKITRERYNLSPPSPIVCDLCSWGWRHNS